MWGFVTATAVAAVMSLGVVAQADAQAAPRGAGAKPTVVLVHGAFAESASWNGVVAALARDGYTVVAAANPLRGVAADAAAVSTLVGAIKGPVVLVGHSYGGAVISAVQQAANVKALVYVAAFAPEVGETCLELSGRFPGSTLAGTLAPPVALPGGAHDLYIDQQKFPQQFAADVAPDQARLMAATQRPVTDAALGEKAAHAAWKTLPSWSVYGSADRNIPPAALDFMAKRARSTAQVIAGASHVVMVSHPREVAAVIEQAAQGAR